MSLVDQLIAQGMSNNEDFTKELIRIKNKREENSSERKVQELEEKTNMMKQIDQYTLDKSGTSEENIESMKQIDDYTLQEVMKLKEEVSKLKGGQ